MNYFNPFSDIKLIKQEDGTIVNQNGKILVFSIDKFRTDICLGNNCFICGAHPDSKVFNEEHVLPKWLLKKYNLFSKKITLPNTSDFTYSKYKIPCCGECNTLLGDKIEKPVSDLIHRGSDAIIQYFIDRPSWLFFIWLCLIFLKTHLKDSTFYYKNNVDKDKTKIGDYYNWEVFHHIHCIVRTIYTGIPINANVLGSFLIFPAMQRDFIENFDFGDLYEARSIYLRLDDICFISVLNDSGMSQSSLKINLIDKIKGALSPIQIRELFVRLANMNLTLKDRPKFYSDINFTDNKIEIKAKLPNSIRLNDFDFDQYGRMFYHLIKDVLKFMPKPHVKKIIQPIKKGIYSFIIDGNGEFINQIITSPHL